MRFEYLIGMRYLRARRRRAFCFSDCDSFRWSECALGTFALTVTLAVMSGFQEVLRERLLAFNPHITGRKDRCRARNLPRSRRRIAAMPGVAAVSPVRHRPQVMAVSTEQQRARPAMSPAGVLRGVVADRESGTRRAQKTLISRRTRALEQPASGDRSSTTASSAQCRSAGRDHRQGCWPLRPGLRSATS